MRFPSIVPLATPQPQPRREEAAREGPLPLIPAAKELPDDLDARVRLVGEWQLGEP